MDVISYDRAILDNQAIKNPHFQRVLD